MQYNDVLRHTATLHLSLVYPRLLELTDTGPGVGVSSAECRWRLLEKARIHNSDKVLRIHRAREDSGQNEAERINARDALSDAITYNKTPIKSKKVKRKTQSVRKMENNIAKLLIKKSGKGVWPTPWIAYKEVWPSLFGAHFHWWPPPPYFEASSIPSPHQEKTYLPLVAKKKKEKNR